jgi:hypothetical protein
MAAASRRVGVLWYWCWSLGVGGSGEDGIRIRKELRNRRQRNVIEGREELVGTRSDKILAERRLPSRTIES